MSKNETVKIRQNKLKQLLIDQLKKTPTIEHTCQKIGISRMTVSRWRKSNKKFDQEIEKALDEGRSLVSDIAESQMFSLINQGKSEMIKFFLTHNNPRYKDKIELSGTVSTKNDQLTASQKELIRRALKLSSLRNYDEKENKKTNDQNG